MNRRLRTALIPIAAAAVIAASFSFAPVREAAAGFLNIFRVQKVQTITISTGDLKQMRRLGESGAGKVDIKNLGKFETSGVQEPQLATLDDAQKAVDFGLKLPGTIAGYGAPTYKVQRSFTNTFTLNVAQANKLIGSFGGAKLLPKALDGKTFTAKMPTIVIATYPKNGGGELMVAAARSPEFILPDDVDPSVVRDALLALPVLPDDIKKQLEGITDWKHTMIIPNVDGSAQDVTVNGADGVFITPSKVEVPTTMQDKARAIEKFSKGRRDMGNALVWQSDGVIRGIAGKLTLEQASGIAAAMK